MSIQRRLYEFRRLFRHRWFLFIVIAALMITIFVLSGRISQTGRIDEPSVQRLEKREIAEKAGGDEKKKTNIGPVLTAFRDGVPSEYEPEAIEHKEGPGENGKPVETDMSSADVQQANREFGFNSFASDKISLDRTIPDTRPSECKYWHYPAKEKLPSASVVVVFHNEGWSPLLRTVHSVLNRSPPELLEEVLMVDDFSDKQHLKDKLEKYIEQFKGRVRLIRNKEREGLIRSRSIGAENAKGQVVIFLDAHCETNTNWLPPLLAPIAENWRTVTVPVIDSIDMNTWAYHPQYGFRGDELFRGIFEWGLLYKESELPEKEKKNRNHTSEPFNSPTHAGGLFAINRQWFADLGYYDPGLQIWGGENFELSFKVWQCGGRILNVPCSRVGHVYRNHMPYSFGNLKGPVISTNYKRVAAAWMDEYIEYYYRREPFMRYREPGDMSKQKAIREKLNCKSFDWFMKEVAYDVIPQYPLPPPNIAWGELKNLESSGSECLDTMGQPIPGTLGVSGCHHSGGNQLFRLNTEGQLTTGEWCVIAAGTRVQSNRCQKGTSDGFWEYRNATKQIYNKEKKRCMSAESNNILKLEPCDETLAKQKWDWAEVRI